MQAAYLTAVQQQQGTNQLHSNGFVLSIDVERVASMAVAGDPV